MAAGAGDAIAISAASATATRNMSALLSARAGAPARLVEEPDAPFGLVDKDLELAGGGDVAVLVADVVRLAHFLDQLLIVLAQLRQHVERFDIFGVIVVDALVAGDVAD